MKPLLIFVCFAAAAALSSLSAGQPACGPAAVRDRVDMVGGEFSLADLLAPSTCPALRRAAAAVRLGRVPAAGSVRVLGSGEVRDLFRKLAGSVANRAFEPESLRLPERITVRRAGDRASCADIGERILGSLRASPPAAESGAPAPAQPAAGILALREVDCGAAGRIPRDAALETTKTVWDPALGSWEISARCVHPTDCVPFLVRVRGREPQLPGARSAHQEGSAIARPAITLSPPLDPAALSPAGGTPLVRPGETVTLSWDQAGIRLIVPVVCLDRGVLGQGVRARILRGGRVVRAVVAGAGELRAAS